MAGIQFDYFTAAETEQYTFYRIPKALFTESRFQTLSCEAKVLYGMMLDRLGLSIRNQWFDSLGHAYIIFTVEDVMGVMGCQSQKAVRLMKELDTADGIGLIEKKRIGLGRPNRIYVKNFMTRGNGGMDTGTGAGCSSRQPDVADLPHSACASGKKDAELEENAGCAGTAPETAADAESTDAASMPETQAGQDWRMHGESTADSGICGESSPDGENWWDMETGTTSTVQTPGQTVQPCGNTGMGFEDAPGAVDSVDIVDNVDKCRNFMADYQNSVHRACFPPEMQTPEKGYGRCPDAEPQPEPPAFGELRIPHSVGRRLKSISSMEFDDKTVEAMVRELWGEEKTDLSGSAEYSQNPPDVSRQCSQNPQDVSRQCGQNPPDVSRQYDQKPQQRNGERRDSMIVETETQQQRDSKRNDTEYSKTEYSETEKKETDFSDVCSSYLSYQSYQSCQPCPSATHAQGMKQTGTAADSGKEWSERKMDACRACIRENIDYQCFRPQDSESVDELVELMADTMLLPDGAAVRIAGVEKPASAVKSRFMKLAHSHIEYVMECMQRHTGKIRNIVVALLDCHKPTLIRCHKFK